MKNETHLFNAVGKGSIFGTKVDLLKEDDDCIKGFRVTFWDRTFEYVSTDDEPIFVVRKTEERDKETIRKQGFQNVGKVWTAKDVEDLTNLYLNMDCNIKFIANELERTERSISMKLESLDLIKLPTKRRRKKFRSKW